MPQPEPTLSNVYSFLEQLAPAAIAGGLISQFLHLCAQDESLNRALHFAAARLDGHHRGRHREPAILHALRVAAVTAFIFDEPASSALIVALLHDVIEDTDTEPEELAALFGEHIADAVVLLTKPALFPKPERRRIYEEALLGAPEEVVLIKLADCYDNLQCRRGTRRAGKTLRAAARLLAGFSARRRLKGRTRRALRIVQDLVTEIASVTPSR